MDIQFGLLICKKKMFLESVYPFPKQVLVCSTSLLKTLWEKEKLLVASNFTSSHKVFYPFGELSSSNMILSSANSFSLEKSKIRHLGKAMGKTGEES